MKTTIKDFFKLERPTTVEVYCDSEGGQWSSQEYLLLMPDWSEQDFFLEMCKLSDELAMEYYDNDEDGIYEEDFESEEDYLLAYDEACFSASGMMTFEFTLNGIAYVGNTSMASFDELEKK
jgi:hypothetical protein